MLQLLTDVDKLLTISPSFHTEGLLRNDAVIRVYVRKLKILYRASAARGQIVSIISHSDLLNLFRQILRK